MPLSPVTARLIALRQASRRRRGHPRLHAVHRTILCLLGEVQAALNAVAFTDSKLEPAVLRALEDRSPLRRAAAAEALCQSRHAEHQAAVRRLLNDPDAGVRLQAALALRGLHDKAALPVLIAQIREADPEHTSYRRGVPGTARRRQGPGQLPQGYDEASRAEAQRSLGRVVDRQRRQGYPSRPTSLDRPTRMLGYTLLVAAAAAIGRRAWSRRQGALAHRQPGQPDGCPRAARTAEC